MIEREHPLSLGGVQALPVPGHCGIGGRELELHIAQGHTGDGMAVMIGWAGVLVAGDYLSAVELPSLGEGEARRVSRHPGSPAPARSPAPSMSFPVTAPSWIVPAPSRCWSRTSPTSAP